MIYFCYPRDKNLLKKNLNMLTIKNNIIKISGGIIESFLFFPFVLFAVFPDVKIFGVYSFIFMFALSIN